MQKYVGGKEGEVKNDQKAPGARFPQPAGSWSRGGINGQPAEQEQGQNEAEDDPAEGARDCQRGPPGAKPGHEPPSQARRAAHPCHERHGPQPFRAPLSGRAAVGDRGGSEEDEDGEEDQRSQERFFSAAALDVGGIGGGLVNHARSPSPVRLPGSAAGLAGIRSGPLGVPRRLDIAGVLRRLGCR